MREIHEFHEMKEVREDMFHMLREVAETQGTIKGAIDKVVFEHRDSLELIRLQAFLLVLNLILVLFAIYIRGN